MLLSAQGSEIKSVDRFIKDKAGLESAREKNNQQERDMMARELLIKFQMSPNHPMVQLNKAYREF